jgi:hypothetical protein
MNHAKYIRFLLLILVIISAFLLTSCDGEILIQGKAFEWVNPPEGAKSMIFILNADRSTKADPQSKPEATLQRLIDNIPSGVNKIPLEAVKVTETHNSTKNTFMSNFTGDFENWRVTDAGEYNIAISAEKEGYLSISGQTKHQLLDAHMVVIVLVRDKK